MKRIVCMVLALLMMVTFVGCGTADTSVDTDVSGDTVAADVGSTEQASTDANDVVSDEETDSAEWKEFLKDYEKWVDEYIVVVKKYKDNPTDFSILSDYTEMMADLVDWSTKADDVQKSIKNTDDALEYSKEVLRIAGKLAEVGQ